MSYQNLKNFAANLTAFVTGVDKADRTSLFNRIRLNDEANAFRLMSLGGSRENAIQGSGTFDLLDYEEVELDGTLLSGYTVTVRWELKTENAATSVTPVMRNVTDSTDTTGSAVTATSWTAQSMTLTLAAGAKKYRPRLTTNNATWPVYAKCYLEIKSP